MVFLSPAKSTAATRKVTSSEASTNPAQTSSNMPGLDASETWNYTRRQLHLIMRSAFFSGGKVLENKHYVLGTE